MRSPVPNRRSAKAHYDYIKVLSETEFYDDLKAIDVPVLVMHGEDDQICPFPTTGARSVKLLKHGTLKSYPDCPTECRPPIATSSTPACSSFSGRRFKRRIVRHDTPLTELEHSQLSHAGNALIEHRKRVIFWSGLRKRDLTR